MPIDCFADLLQRKAEFIMRQTNYTLEEALAQLQANENDPLKVIRLYMGVNTTPVNREQQVAASAQQQRFTEIRGMMDKAAMNYLRQREYQRIQQQIQQAREQAAKHLQSKHLQSKHLQPNSIQHESTLQSASPSESKLQSESSANGA